MTGGLGAAVARAVASGATTLTSATVSATKTAGYAISINGLTVPARWIDTATVAAGDTVLVALTRGPVGQSSAVVLGRLTDAPRPTVGKIREVIGAKCTVTTDSGDVTADFIGSAPAVGARVRLLWQGAACTVIGTVGVSVAAASVDAGVGAPGQSTQAAQSGSSVLRATGSGSWTVSGTRWTTAVTQGTGYGLTNVHGGWGYGSPLAALSGAKVKSATLTITGRTSAGVFSSPSVFHLSAHSQTDLTDRPETAYGGWDITVPGRGDGFPIYLSVPTDMAQWIVDHRGGLLVSGGTYSAVEGIDVSADSGKLTINWER